MADIADIKKRITALLKMTKAAGCSEAEAMAAAEKAAALMAEYDLQADQLTMDEQATRSKSSGKGARDRIVGAVALCTNTAPIFLSVWGKNEVRFFGHAPGPEIATYLFVVLNRAIDAEVAVYKSSRNYRRRATVASRRAAVNDFTNGLVTRLCSRLWDLFRSSSRPADRAMAKAARDLAHPTARDVAPPERKHRFNSKAYFAGHDAANRVQLAHGMAQGEKVEQIEARPA